MKPQTGSTTAKEVPLNLVGTNKFGRYDKISAEETFNMIVSDQFLVPFAGYGLLFKLLVNGQGRAIFTSVRWGNMVAVVLNTVIQIDPDLNVTQLFTIDTFSGDVFIDENLLSQIAICDKSSLWVYKWSTGNVTKVTLPTGMVPGYVTFQDGYFIVPDITTSQWYLSSTADGTNFLWGAGNSAVFTSIQTKPTNVLACLRAPGRGTLLYVFGQTVTELWNDAGLQIFPYQRNNSVSIDYGCLSANTISSMDNTVAWLGINERSGPVILVSQGADVTRISNDGIDYVLANLNFPERSYGFFFKQDGHLFYVLSFVDPSDNVSYCYDFNSQGFSTLTDENHDVFIALRVAFFNDTYYFVSFKNSNLYNISTNFTTYDNRTQIQREQNHPSTNYLIKTIPRIRNCPPIRFADTERYVANGLTFTVEQGDDPYFRGSTIAYVAGENGVVIASENYISLIGQNNVDPYYPYVQLAASRDGGETFSNLNLTVELNPLGNRPNKVMFWQLGAVNDLTLQFRFIAKGRMVVGDGIIAIR